MTTFQKWIRTN